MSKRINTIYIWQSIKDNLWYRTGVSSNGKISLPSQGYTRKATAEDLTPTRNLLAHHRIVYSKPPEQQS